MEQMVSHSSSRATYSRGRFTKFLTAFDFARGSYGLRISVVGCMELVEFEESANFVRGFIELRDEKIAVIDPRILFEINSTPIDSQTCIVIAENFVGGKKIKVGVVVEDLSEVLNIASYKMDGSDVMNHSINIDFILKLSKKSDTLDMLRDIEKSMDTYSITNHCYKTADCV